MGYLNEILLSCDLFTIKMMLTIFCCLCFVVTSFASPVKMSKNEGKSLTAENIKNKFLSMKNARLGDVEFWCDLFCDPDDYDYEGRLYCVELGCFDDLVPSVQDDTTDNGMKVSEPSSPTPTDTTTAKTTDSPPTSPSGGSTAPSSTPTSPGSSPSSTDLPSSTQSSSGPSTSSAAPGEVTTTTTTTTAAPATSAAP